MSAKTSAEVVIDGKVYTLSGYEGEEYLQKVAAYINNKINEFEAIEDYRHIPLNMKNTLIQLNIADDYFKSRKQIGDMEEDMNAKEKELYDLKHELVNAQMKLENMEKNLAAAKMELQAKDKKIIQLEAEIRNNSKR